LALTDDFFREREGWNCVRFQAMKSSRKEEKIQNIKK
jgi:hypothetical protein